MNAERELNEAYQEWRQLAETEGQAIGAANWHMVFACQKALKNLQERISRLTPAAKKEWARPGCDRAGKEKAFNETLHELIRIQRRNTTLLESLKEATRAKLDELGRANRNLRHIHQSYTLNRSPVWTSFS